MIDIILIVFFSVIAVRIASTVVNEAAIFKEFNQSRSLGIVVMLFPLGPLVLITLPFRIGWAPTTAVAVFCYLPSLIISRRLNSAFEQSGTDRTQSAQKATTQAFGTSIFGLIYVAIFLSLIYLGNSMYELGA